MPSLHYECLCLLFNIGVLQGQIAANQNFQSDDGLKTAAKMFQVRLHFQDKNRFWKSLDYCKSKSCWDVVLENCLNH